MKKRTIAAIIAACVLVVILASAGLLYRGYQQSAREVERINAMECMERTITSSLIERLEPQGVEPASIKVQVIETAHPEYTGLVTYYDADGREVSRRLTITADDRRDSFIWRLERR